MSKIEEYDKKCATCTHISLNRNNLSGRFYCNDYQLYVSLSDSCRPKILGGYSFNKNITDKEIEYAEKKVGSGNSSSNSCYITTIVCNILGLEDDCIILNDLRKFRDNYLQKNPKYYPILINYDTIGPQIAKNIEEDEHKFDIAKEIMKNYLIPCVRIINTVPVNQEAAVDIYMKMTKKLANMYGINNEYPSIDIKDDIISYTGHGKKLIYN